LLEFEGYEIVSLNEEHSVEKIWETLQRVRPDLMLVDVNLGTMNGFDLLRKIKQDEELKTMRVIMSSGLELSDQCTQEGADGFIQKPYMPEDLLTKIRFILGN